MCVPNVRVFVNLLNAIGCSHKITIKNYKIFILTYNFFILFIISEILSRELRNQKLHENCINTFKTNMPSRMLKYFSVQCYPISESTFFLFEVIQAFSTSRSNEKADEYVV